MQESYWRFIWCIRICSMHSHSQGFKGYCETKRIIQPAIPREPGWYQEKVLRCRTLFFTSLFTFCDFVLFSRLCKSWSFFNWSFSFLQRPWSWLRSRLILYIRFPGVKEVTISTHGFAFFPNVFLSYIAFAFHFKVSTQFGQSKFSLFAEICLTSFRSHACCREITTIWRWPYCPKKIPQCPEACVVRTHSNCSKNKEAPNSYVLWKYYHSKITVESEFFEPQGEMKIGSKNRIFRETWGN